VAPRPKEPRFKRWARNKDAQRVFNAKEYKWAFT
jgi:hypothetical protein